MLPIHHFCLLQTKLPSSSIFPPLISHLIQNDNNYYTKNKAKAKKRKSLSSSSWVVHAVEKDSKQFEVDPDKAKEALQKLDQQLQTLSKKQVNTPKIRASEVKLARDKMVEEEDKAEAVGAVDILSGSFLANLTVGLLIFTIFYNVLFYAVIKPSVDGPDSPDPIQVFSSSTQSDEPAPILQ